MIQRNYTEADILAFRNKLSLAASQLVCRRPRSFDELNIPAAKDECTKRILNAMLSVEPTPISFNEFKFVSLNAVIKVLIDIVNSKACCETPYTMASNKPSRQSMVSHILQSIR